MNLKTMMLALVAATATLAAPAFASGYGPAPSYDPLVGAPASQRGQSTATLAAERPAVDGGAQAYGGARARSEAGSRVAADSMPSLYLHR
jgi:hypothetical protein